MHHYRNQEISQSINHRSLVRKLNLIKSRQQRPLIDVQLFSWLKLWIGITEHFLKENFRIQQNELFHEADGAVPALNPTKSMLRIKGVHGVHFNKKSEYY